MLWDVMHTELDVRWLPNRTATPVPPTADIAHRGRCGPHGPCWWHYCIQFSFIIIELVLSYDSISYPHFTIRTIFTKLQSILILVNSMITLTNLTKE